MEEDSTVKHRRKLSLYIAPPAPLHHFTTGLTHQVTHVTHQFHRQFADILWVHIKNIAILIVYNYSAISIFTYVE